MEFFKFLIEIFISFTNTILSFRIFNISLYIYCIFIVVVGLFIKLIKILTTTGSGAKDKEGNNDHT